MVTDTHGAPIGVLETGTAFLASVSGFDPYAVSVPDCARVADLAARVEKAASGIAVLAAARAADAGAHKEEGFSDPAAWLARHGGTTGAQGRRSLALAGSLEELSATKDALVSGAISLAQAEEIARAEADCPGAEAELLDAARNGDLTAVRDEARERRLASTKPEELHRRQHEARRFRHWKDDLGMVRIEGALPPETGIPLVTRTEREAARLRGEAKKLGEPEPFGAYAADALLALVAGAAEESRAGGKTTGRTDLVIVCDLFAWRRGHAHEGEVCHIVGGGPIPLDLAKVLAEDAFLKVVLHDGKRIQVVSHRGRRYTAELKTALDLGPVPAFTGRACVDCKRTWGLEHDHTDPIAHTGKTSMGNIVDRCTPCHAEKTERDRRAGLLGKKAKARGPGPPPGREPRERAGPPRSASPASSGAGPP